MVRVLLTVVITLGILTIFLAGSVAAADSDFGACDLQRLAFVPKTEDIERIELLLEQGANVNGKSGGKPLLIAACALLPSGNENKIRLAQILLEKGADPNILDNLGDTALINLLKPSPDSGKDIVAMTKLLLHAGADVNARDNQGHSAFMLGLKHRNKDVFQLFKALSQKDRQSVAPPALPEGDLSK
jgi:ankyrin repeat protein